MLSFIIFFPFKPLKKDQLWFQFNFFFQKTKQKKTLHGHFFKFVPDGFSHRMIDYPLSVSCVVKLRNLQQTGLELCFMVNGRKDNP